MCERERQRERERAREKSPLHLRALVLLCTARDASSVPVSGSVYRGWVVLGSGLTDVLDDALVDAASDEHGLEVFGAVKKPFHDRVLVCVSHVEIRCSSGDGNDDLPRRDMSCTHAHMQVCSLYRPGQATGVNMPA